MTKKYFVCQVATIARPPVDPAHKRPSTDYTGYIICIYQVRILAADWRTSCRVFSILTSDWLQVFKGDDGEKFERNWLYWTGIHVLHVSSPHTCPPGARMLYKNLPRNVGLRRLTLHKSATGPNVNYILLVECSHFLDNINQVQQIFFSVPTDIFMCGYLQAANLLPVLRARICGYTGIFRIVESF